MSETADADESRRLLVLDGYGILDTPAEPGFDGIVLLASQICQAPVALVSLVAADRQWFKARTGFDGRETPLDVSICRHALARPGLLVIPDLTQDPRTRENALVTGEPFIRFYAGARLETPEGLALGTLCVIDTKARPEGLSAAQATALEVLAGQVMAQMELRRTMQARDTALRAMREGDVRQRQILESAVDFAIIATDRAGLVTDWNTGAERIFGWTSAEMRGKPTDRFFTPEDRAADRVGLEMRRALEEGRGNDERWHLRKDGSRFWANGEMMPLRNEAGEHIGFIKIVRDETSRREAGEKLRLSEEFLQGVLASSDDCIQVLDLDGNLAFMSEGGRRAMEVADFEALRGRAWPVTCPDDLRPTANAAVEAARAGGTGHYQARTDTFAGTPKWWDVRVTPILDGEGKPEKLLAISRDITAARHAEAALREAEGLNSLILNSSGDCTVVLDLDGHTLFVSPGGIEAMEISDVDAIIGLSWLRVWKGADNEAARNAVAEARAGRKGQFQGFCPTLKGTPKWWDVVISPLLGPDGEPERLVSVGRDITASRQVAEKLARSQERLNLALGASGMVGIWDWDLRADVIYADANFARIYTVDPEWAARGAPLSEYVKNIHPDDLSDFQAELDRLFAGAEEFSNEYRIFQPGGSVRWVLARGRLVRDDDGTPIRFPGASVDITERKQAEARRLAVLDLGDRLRDLTDPAEMAFAAAEVMGQTLDASRAGYGTVSLAGEVITIERDWAVPGVAGIAGTHTFRDFGSFVDELKQGSMVVVDDTETDRRTVAKTSALDAIGVRSVINLPIFEHGRFVAMFYVHDDKARHWGVEQTAFVRNVADRTRAAIERRLAEDRLRDLNADLERRVEERTRERDRVWRNSQDLLVVIDRRGVFRSVSPVAEKILGWSPDEMLGLTVFDFVHPDDLPSTGRSLDKAKGEELPTYLNRYRRKDGTYRWMSWVAAPEDDLIYAYGRDVTAEKEKTEALRLAEEQLR
ncbi:PAS domain S-box protein, partial [Lichenifustis flavocetrariae]